MKNDAFEINKTKHGMGLKYFDKNKNLGFACQLVSN